jgi:hypothetical protein
MYLSARHPGQADRPDGSLVALDPLLLDGEAVRG